MAENDDSTNDLGDGTLPQKMVKDFGDMGKWKRSVAYYDILGFINGISMAIQGKRITDDMFVSPFMQKLLDILGELEKLLDEVPPAEQPQRFGNKAYRIWSKLMNSKASLLLKEAIPEKSSRYVAELSYYLTESFGNAVRIDYGTGHEFSFMFFLCSLYKAELLKIDDNVAVALRLFNKYLLLCRRLQLTYRMEPAGSQGVWALDDYQFVPFVWGSAQLSSKTPFDPSKFLDEPIIEKYKDQYMFLGCIDYITKVKTGHFAEHSNQLWGISAVPTWPRIHSGLMKMYEKEILSKFPVIQHCCFGELMRFDPAPPGSVVHTAQLGETGTESSHAPPPSHHHSHSNETNQSASATSETKPKNLPPPQ